MKKNNRIMACAIAAALACPLSAQTLNVSYSGDTAIIKVTNPTKYLILPIEEEKPEALVKLDTGSAADTWMDIRLAVNKTDYCVPFALGNGKEATVKIANLPKNALALSTMRLSNDWDTTNTDFYRPVYHHTPLWGWMNDPNGMVYKDGEYHLYYQYNPYGSKWGNMHWGHSISKDLIHWDHTDQAIARDTLGQIFSGSSVIDVNNTAGYGKNTIVSFYTSASEKNGQIQCMAYSTDNGRTFTKYEKNPVLTPFDGLKDFRDPKVFWYAPKKRWYMIVSADKEMRFYSSKNLKEWTYVSGFGKGYGAQPNQFECPDFFPLTVNGKTKYVMIVNINPGCLFGGSATEYFVGDFDGKKFTCDTAPEVAKWLDYGKDHYAAVTFSGTGDRVVALPWMSNWQYANVTPIMQYRGANGLPRELSLYEKDGQYYVAANVVPEAKALRKSTKTIADLTLGNTHVEDNLFKDNDGAFELEADVTPNDAGIVGIDLTNTQNEKVKIYLDLKEGRIVMDRTQSGLTDFGKRAAPHAIELEWEAQRKGDGMSRTVKNAVNYVNNFSLGTWAPLNLCEGKTYHLDIFVDKCSVELFVDGGRIAMTNLVFPIEPYNGLRFYAEGGTAEVKNIQVHKLGL